MDSAITTIGSRNACYPPPSFLSRAVVPKRQFLDAVAQIGIQFPRAFEFNDDFLVALADLSLSGWFAGFNDDNEASRVARSMAHSASAALASDGREVTGAGMAAVSVWDYLDARRPAFSNPGYAGRPRSAEPSLEETLLRPACTLKKLTLWARYLRYDHQVNRVGYSHSHRLPSGNVFWVPDSFQRECTACLANFTFFKRRHHCRSCGLLFCSACSRRRVQLPELNYTKKVRICDKCFEERRQAALESELELSVSARRTPLGTSSHGGRGGHGGHGGGQGSRRDPLDDDHGDDDLVVRRLESDDAGAGVEPGAA